MALHARLRWSAKLESYLYSMAERERISDADAKFTIFGNLWLLVFRNFLLYYTSFHGRLFSSRFIRCFAVSKMSRIPSDPWILFSLFLCTLPHFVNFWTYPRSFALFWEIPETCSFVSHVTLKDFALNSRQKRKWTRFFQTSSKIWPQL